MAGCFRIKSVFTMAYSIGITILIAGIILGISCKAPDSTGDSSTTPADNEVVMENLAFVPATLSIPAGTVVTWRNNDSSAHTVTALENSFESGTLSNGGTFSFTFTQKGTYEYYCRLHPSMTGKIIVE